MRRADIARVSTVSSGADYVFTLPDLEARGRRVTDDMDSTLQRESEIVRLLGRNRPTSRYGVTHWRRYLDQPSVRTSHGVAFLHVPGVSRACREGFAVISRCFEQRFRCSHP